MSQKRITSSTPILNHDVTHELALASQFDGRQQVGLLTIPADEVTSTTSPACTRPSHSEKWVLRSRTDTWLASTSDMPSLSFVTALAASRHGAALGDDAAIRAQQHGHHGSTFEVVIFHQQADKASLSRSAYRQQAIGVVGKGFFSFIRLRWSAGIQSCLAA